MNGDISEYLGTIATELIHEKVSSHFKMEFGFVIFWNRWINFLSFSKFNIAKMKYCGNNSENCFLRERERESSEGGPSYLFVINQLKLSLKRMNLFLVTYPNNFHCSPCGKIIMRIAYTNQVIAIWLVKIVKWFRVSQLVLLNFLLRLTTLDEFSNEVR